MTTIYDATADFALTALAGFCATHARLVRLVEGGVVRATEVPKGKVSIVVGGGSGHYPAGHPFHMVRKSVINQKFIGIFDNRATTQFNISSNCSNL